MSAQNNLAARAARWSAAHRKLAIFGWVAFVAISVAIGIGVGTKELGYAEAVSGEAGRAERAIERAGLNENSELVLIQSERLRAGDAAFDAAVAEATRRLDAIPAVTGLSSPADGGGRVSPDGHSALIEFRLPGTEEQAAEKVDPTLAATAAAQTGNPGVRIEQFGMASAGKALDEVFAEDLRRAETTSLPITLLVLLLAFGALVAALVPLLVAFSAVIATVGLLALPSQLVPMDSNVPSVVILVGLAVGVDYSLFYMRREREERRAGRAVGASLQAAAATAGRAVLISGLTVISAMAGMLISGDPTFTSFAVATMTVVAVAMFASLTVLPAILAGLGDRVEWGRVPLLRRLRERRSGRSAWDGVVGAVMRRPWVALLGAGGLLVALAIPALGLNPVVSGAEDLPRDIPVVQTYDRITGAFPGEAAGAKVVVEAAETEGDPVGAAIDRFVARAETDPQVAGPVTIARSADGSVAAIEVPTVGSGADSAATRASEHVRDTLVPAAFATAPGAEVNVTGDAAASQAFSDLLAERLPLVFAFVLGLAFLLMLVTFRSVVVPLKAIALNLLSVGAAYGVLVLVFQNGWGESALGFESNGGVSSWLPLFLFVILFGLSMDYHVLILSRVREFVDAGHPTEEAVGRGIAATAGTVTSAAAVMVAVFSIFATLSIIDMKEMGVGLAVAILIDATIVRAILLPAAMKLLGERNWYMPRWLEWLPRIEHGEANGDASAEVPAVREEGRSARPGRPRPAPREVGPQALGD